MFKTADLCDAHPDVQVADPLFRDFGGVTVFHGAIVTVKAYEDNTSVRALLEQQGAGQVLVVDGGGSLRCALVGDNLAQLGYNNGWAGVVIYGCIRDAAEVGQIPIGVKAMATNPRRSKKQEAGEVNIEVRFAGITFTPGHYLYADADGVIVSATEIVAE
ncbi:MAG: ribonuclease E activity regulator RraA [Caldilineaceae bacterium]|nr:ribonuclease E activity regulator RraA [Caldilineaceae bacterium]